MELLGVDIVWQQNLDSPLLNRYREAINAAESDGSTEDKYLQHARGIMELIRNMSMGYLRGGGIGFKHSVRRIELLSPGLMGDPPAEG